MGKTVTLVPGEVGYPLVPAQSNSITSYWMAYSIIAVLIVLISIFTDPTRYADFDTYVYYLDTLVYYPPSSWLYFEVFSNLNLLAAHWVTQSVLSGIVFSHYMLGIIFMLAVLIAYPPRRTTWPALLFTFAVLGPLLAFVTLRATPAYFLIAISVRYAIERRMIAWLCLAVAASFHVSALLAGPALALLYFERNLPAFLRSNQSPRYYLRIALGIVGICAILPQISESLTAFLNAIPVLSKYEVYTDVGETAATRVGHYLFLIFITTFTVSYFFFQNESSSKINMYVLASFSMYIFLFFLTSPVVAFRQSPFWIMPVISVLPWERIGLGRSTAPFFILACAGLGAFQFSQIYV